MPFFFVQVYRDLKSCTSLSENVSLRVPPSNLREFSLFCACPSNKHCPSARCPMLPTWWVKISTYLHLEPFLLIVYMLLALDRILLLSSLFLCSSFLFNSDLHYYYYYYSYNSDLHYYYSIIVINFIELLLLLYFVSQS
jgi:hypothetical protein